MFLTAEPVLEVHDRRGIHDGSTKQSVYAAFVVVHFADLRLHITSDCQAIFGTVDAQLKTEVVVLTYVASVAALLLVLHHILGIEEIIIVIDVHAQHVVEWVEDGTDVSIIVAEVVAIVVSELQESLIGDGLAVTEARREVVVVVRTTIILHFMIDGVAAIKCLEEVVIRLRVTVSVVVRVAVTASKIECDVPAWLFQPFVDLKRGRGVDVLGTAPIAAQPVVYANLLSEVEIVGKRGGGELKGVVVPSC